MTLATAAELGSWYTSAESSDWRRYTTVASDGSVLFGDQYINEHQSVIGPAYLHTTRGRTMLWSLGASDRARVPYENLSERLVYYSPPRSLYGLEHGTIATLGYGWPFVAIATDYEFLGPGASNVVTGLRLSSSTTFINHDYPRAIPTRVIWLGLVANIALYTIVMYLLLLIGLRRPFIVWRRKIQGRCLPCGYPLDDLTVCPECGTAKGERRPAPGLIDTG